MTAANHHTSSHRLLRSLVDDLHHSTTLNSSHSSSKATRVPSALQRLVSPSTGATTPMPSQKRRPVTNLSKQKMAADRVVEQVEALMGRPSSPLNRNGDWRRGSTVRSVSPTSVSDDDKLSDRSPSTNLSGSSHIVENTAASAWRNRLDMVLRRKADAFEEKMVSRLESFLENDDRRVRAKDVFIEKSNDERRRQWLMIFSHAAYISLLGHQLQLRRAYVVLRQKFLYQYLRYVRKRKSARQRSKLLAERMASMERPPSREILRDQIPVFQKLPDAVIDALCAVMVKRCLFAGEFVAYEGEPGDAACILHRGKIAINKRDQPGMNAQGSPTNGMGPSTLRVVPSKALGAVAPPPQQQQPSILLTKPSNIALQQQTTSSTSMGICIAQTDVGSDRVNTYGWTIGQTMLLTSEPYEYSFRAAQDCDFWVLSGSQFLETIAATMAPTVPKQLEVVYRMIDERRAKNMQRLRAMTEQTLRASSPLFQFLTPAGIARILQQMRPVVVRRADVVVDAGHYGSNVVFVVGGRVEVTSFVPPSVQGMPDTKKVETVRVGCCTGEIAAVLGKKDTKTSVRATTNADLWLLERSDLQNVLIHEDSRTVMIAVLSLGDDNQIA